MMQCGRTDRPSDSASYCSSSVAPDRIMATEDCSGQWQRQRGEGGGGGGGVEGGGGDIGRWQRQWWWLLQ